jgi:hypothetical protein
MRSDARHEIVDRFRIAQLDARQLKAAVDEVHVIVDEARYREAAAQIDDLCVLRNRRVNSGDAVAFDDNIRGKPVAGPDPAVRQRKNGYSSSLICCAR